MSVGRNLNLFFFLQLTLLSNLVFSEPDIEICQCNETYESFCRLPDSEFSFEGFCKNSNIRIVGKTYYKNGGVFDGLYREDNTRYIGQIDWGNGNTLTGEFGIDHNEYSLPESRDPDEYFVLGEYLLGTISSRGFFTTNEDEFLVLTGYGTKFNTNPEDGWTYQSGYFENDELSGESLLVLRDEIDYDLGMWFDVSQKSDAIVYATINGKKSRMNSDFDEIAEGWGEEGEAIVSAMAANLSESHDEMDANFAILSAKRDSLTNSETEGTKITKPLSSEMTSSLQKLLAALGYETGKIDGILGKLTIAAIKAFQKEEGLEITGRPSEDLLIILQTELRRSKTSTGKNSKDSIKLPVVSTGTGFFIQDHIVITNQHVIEKCTYLSAEGGSTLTIEAEDLINDLAVLKSSLRKIKTLPLSSNPELGQVVYAGGYPYNNILRNFNFSSGNISSLLGPGSNISEFQFTAPIQPGSSGGAILNEKGGVIGIAVSTASLNLMKDTESIPQNINFGIKVELLKDILVENQIDFDKGNSFWFNSSQEEIAKLSKDASTVIKCHDEKKLRK